MTKPLFAVGALAIPGRDLVLLGGGSFLLAKSVHAMHSSLEGADGCASSRVGASFAALVSAVAVMMFAAAPISNFVRHHPTVKMLAR